MKKLLILLVVALSGLVHADWKLNPYTQRQDYYEATGSLHISTAALNARINAVAISTGANASAIAAETAARVAGDAALALSTAPLKDYANWNTAYGWGDHAGKYLISPASFTYLNDASKFLVAPASFTYQSPGNYITSLTGNVTASGPGAASATIVSVPQSAVNLSTVTTALALKADSSALAYGLAGKLSNTATIPTGLVDLSTVTTALSAKADVASVIPSSATGYYGISVASAAYAANGFIPGTSILNNGSYGLVTSSDVVAHAYYGDGSHLTGLAGTGDVVKAATQTFTGGNTFTGSVTVSSLTVTTATVVNTVYIGDQGDVLTASRTSRATNMLQVVASTTAVNATNITFSGLKPATRYKVYISATKQTSSILFIHFNNDGGSNYRWAYQARAVITGAGADGSNSDTGIRFCASDAIYNGDIMDGEITFQTSPAGGQYVRGNSSCSFINAAGNYETSAGGFAYNGASNLSSLSIIALSGTFSAYIYVMELQK